VLVLDLYSAQHTIPYNCLLKSLVYLMHHTPASRAARGLINHILYEAEGMTGRKLS
nr:hypothetical protein [Tanacetum cinerariifolium]